MSESVPLRRMSGSTASQLEAFISLYQDLRYVMRLTYEAIEILKKDEQDPFALKTYWSSALIAYRRAFNTGVRTQKAPTDKFVNHQGAMEVHEYFLNQADKLIAHSVNPFEEVFVGVFINSEGSIIGAGELTGQLFICSQETLNDLNQLAKIATQNLEEEIKQLKDKLFDEASRLNKDDRLKLPEAYFTAPDPANASKSRKKSN